MKPNLCLTLVILLFLILLDPKIGACTSLRIEEDLPGPKSIYTDWILNWLRHGGAKRENLVKTRQANNSVQLRCIETPGTEFYIGLEQLMMIDAPIANVTTVLNQFEHYQDLFTSFADIHLVSKNSGYGNFFVVSFEQKVPFFFVPNVKYELYYIVEQSQPDRKIYRYKLKEEGKIKKSDGIIFLEPVGLQSTRYIEYDFFDADWGLAKIVAPGRIWKDSVEGIYKSDLSIKVKAEHPSWDYAKVISHADQMADDKLVEQCINDKSRGP